MQPARAAIPGFARGKRPRSATDRSGGGVAVPEPDDNPDDEQLAGLLVRMWSVASGRRLRAGVRPDQHTVEELIGFWADDLTPSSGRHAARGPDAHAW